MERSVEQQYISIGDENIIELYWLRDERAIEETARKYRNYLLSVAGNFLSEKSECEECVSDTYLAAWRAIPPAKPKVLKAFLVTILRRIAINRYHHNSRKRVVPSNLTVSLEELNELHSDDGVDSYLDADAFSRHLNDFVRGLSKRKRVIFVGRYYMADSIDCIAKNLSVSKSTVNKELASIRAALKAKLESEGYSI